MKLIDGVWHGERTQVLKARARSVVKVKDGDRAPSVFRLTAEAPIDWLAHVGRLVVFAGIYMSCLDQSPGYEPVQAWVVGHDAEGGLISFTSPDRRYDFDGQEGDFVIFEVEVCT